jgi:plasmid stabilization system protein ParE
MECIFSPLSEYDLEEIGEYIARDNPIRAVTFVNEIIDRCLLIPQMPESSPLRENFYKGVRVAPFGNYLIYYTIHKTEKEIRIERILHAARDINQSFFH